MPGVARPAGGVCGAEELRPLLLGGGVLATASSWKTVSSAWSRAEAICWVVDVVVAWQGYPQVIPQQFVN